MSATGRIAQPAARPGRRAIQTAGGKTQKTGLGPVLPHFRYRPLLKAYGSIIDVNAPAPATALMATRTLMDFEGLADTTGQPLQRPRLIDSMSFVPTSQLPVNETAGTSSDASEIIVGNFNGLYLLMREALFIQLLREAYAKTGEIGFLRHIRADVVTSYPQQFTAPGCRLSRMDQPTVSTTTPERRGSYASR